jgi:hypothetical protein
MAISGLQFIRDPAYELRRNPLLETVWKIAEGVLDRVCSVAQDGEMGLLHPLCPLAEPPTGGFPDFPNSFSRHFGEKG